MIRCFPALCVAALLFGFQLQAQQISVESFRRLDNDMDARITHARKDQNGDVCAIIKIVTTETGFTFEGGSLGIVHSEQKVAEIWVWVPHKAQRITIKHPVLGVMRDYAYPETIDKATVYEMKLTTGRVRTIVDQPEIISQWLVITSDPPGADVFINEQPAGKTPYQNEMPVGKYTWRLALDLYLPEASAFELKGGEERKTFDVKLKPNFGSIRLNTTPEQGAAVTLNGIPTGKTTPCTLEKVPAGDVRLSLSLPQYATATRDLTVIAGQAHELSVALDATFCEVNISTEPAAQIFVGNDYKGSGTWQGRLTPGVYTFEARLDKHRTASEKRTVEVRQPLSLTLKPLPITGSLKVKTDPLDASIKLDGENKGLSPLTLRNLLIGEHTIEIEKSGYNTLSKKITIEEGKETLVDETLSNYAFVSISSTPTGAALQVDGRNEGTTPKRLTLSYGEHTVRLEKPGYTTYTGRFSVSPGETTYTFSMISDEAALAGVNFKKYKTRKIITFTAGTLFAGAGTYFWLQSRKHADEYPTATTNATEIYDAMEREQILAGISYGLSAACYTASLVYAVKQGNARRKMEIALSPLPGGAVIGLNLQF